ncbi:MAG: right-handed parallel beta-helix repeat-containing protein [Paludibacteraceae bacterium]|nr:right-handed parallel beta-helix repeat-containing protein [Paludibacteraceae bacterium]
MKRILVFLLLAACAAGSYAKQKEYKVKTALEFVKSLGSDRVITVEGIINLSDVLQYDDKCSQAGVSTLKAYSEPTAKISREDHFDGYQLVLNLCNNLTIQGSPKGGAILIEPRYAFIMSFRNSKNVVIRELTIGHTDEGYCEGGVLEFENCEGVQIDKCDMYGCGTEGITASKTTDLRCVNSIIRDCSYSIMTLSSCFNVKFNDCDFYRNREYTLINVASSLNVSFSRCRFSQNRGPLFYVGDANLSMSDCEIYHQGDLGDLNLDRFATTKYSRQNVELTGKQVGPTVKQNLNPSKQHGIASYDNEPAYEPEPEPTWEDQVIIMPDSYKVADVRTLTGAYCIEWPEDETTVKFLYKLYIDNVIPFKPTNQSANTLTKTLQDENRNVVQYNTAKGWLSLVATDGLRQTLSAGLWNRADGHKLLVVLCEKTVDGNLQQDVVCYDYNPSDRILTPDVLTYKQLTTALANAGNHYLILPRDDKDIKMPTKSFNPDNNFVIKWNGQSFTKPSPVK